MIRILSIHGIDLKSLKVTLKETIVRLTYRLIFSYLTTFSSLFTGVGMNIYEFHNVCYFTYPPGLACDATLRNTIVQQERFWGPNIQHIFEKGFG